jgi:hypothetical protein
MSHKHLRDCADRGCRWYFGEPGKFPGVCIPVRCRQDVSGRRDDARATSTESSSSDRVIQPSGIGASLILADFAWSASQPPLNSWGITRRDSCCRRRSLSARGLARRSEFSRRSTADGRTSHASHERPSESVNRRYDIAPPAHSRCSASARRKSKTCAELIRAEQ